MNRKDVESVIKVTTPDAVQHNKGLEGVAYDAKSDVFYVVQEKNPVQVLKVYRNGTAVSVLDWKKYSKQAPIIARLKCGAK